MKKVLIMLLVLFSSCAGTRPIVRPILPLKNSFIGVERPKQGKFFYQRGRIYFGHRIF